jgi:hypothetical protein
MNSGELVSSSHDERINRFVFHATHVYLFWYLNLLANSYQKPRALSHWGSYAPDEYSFLPKVYSPETAVKAPSVLRLEDTHTYTSVNLRSRHNHIFPEIYREWSTKTQKEFLWIFIDQPLLLNSTTERKLSDMRQFRNNRFSRRSYIGVAYCIPDLLPRTWQLTENLTVSLQVILLNTPLADKLYTLEKECREWHSQGIGTNRLHVRDLGINLITTWTQHGFN